MIFVTTGKHLFLTSHHLDTKQGNFLAKTLSLTALGTHTLMHTQMHTPKHGNMCTHVNAHSHFTANKDPVRIPNQSYLVS